MASVEGEQLLNITPASSLDTERRILKYFGMYPMRDGTLRYRLLGLLTWTWSLSFLLSLWYNVYYNLDRTSVVIETLYFGMTQITFVCKMFNLHCRKLTYENLVGYLEDPSFNAYTPEQHKYILRAVEKSRKFGSVFRITVTITIVFFILFPFLERTLLVVPSYFPVSVERYHGYLFVYQIVGIIYNGYNHSSFDNLTITFITIGSAQFEILMDNLVSLKRTYDGKEESKLRACVKHHVKIIEYIGKIDDMYSFVQFLQFLCSSVIICVTGFQIILTPLRSFKSITLILYFSCNLIQISMVCWFGHNIIDKSTKVGDACYMSEWTECSKEVSQSLYIIMERSKRPVTITAGKFFVLSLQTFMQVLKTGYSYLALLRSMNE